MSNNSTAKWWKEPWKASLVLLLALVIIWAIPRMQTTLTIFFMALVIAFLLDPLVDKLERLKIHRTFAIIVLYSIFLLIISIAALIMFPIIAAQIKDVAIQFPSYLERIYSTIGQWQGVYKKLKIAPSVREHMEKLNLQTIQRVGELVQTFVAGLGTLAAKVISGILMFVASVIISMFLLVNLDKMRNRFMQLIPNTYKEEILNLGRELSRLFGGFLRGQVILCVIMGIGTALGLWVLKLFQLSFNYSLLISMMAGVGYAIPYIGSFIPMVLGGILGYFQNGDWQLPMWVTLIQLIVYQLVNYFGVPLVMGREVGVSPLFIIFAIFAGGELFGFWGVTLSVPIAAALRVCFFYAVKKWQEA